MQLEVAQWESLSSESMSLDAIRKQYEPAARYRVSRNGYDAGVSFPGTGRAGRLYVLSGSCSKSVGDWKAELGPGTFVDFPGGDYLFSVIGDEPVTLVNVWEIPEPYRQKDNTQDGSNYPARSESDNTLCPVSPTQHDVEAYAKISDANAVVSLLSKAIGAMEVDASSPDDLRFYGFKSGTVILQEGQDGFLSVWVRGSNIWASSPSLARFLANELHCAVRCDPGLEFPEASPYSNVFLHIENQIESLVAWG